MRIRLFWSLVAIFVLAATLRLAHAGVESLWFDEAFTVIASRMGPALLLRGEADPVLPPFYFLALHFWQSAVGESEVAVRALSALCSLLAVAVAYRLAARLFGRRASLWMAGLMAVSPFQVYYAQEARPYALIVLLSAGLLWVFAEMLARPTWLMRGGYVVLASLGLYTHYFFGLVLAAMHLWAALYRRRWAFWRCLLIGDGCAVLLFLPHLGTALSRAQTVTGGFWVERPSALAVLKTFDFLLFAGTTPTWLVPLALFGTLGLTAVVGFDLARYSRHARWCVPGVALVLSVIVLPIVVVFVVSRLGSSIYLDRSFALLSPAYLSLLAGGLVIRPRRSPALVLAALLGLVAVISLAHFYFWPDGAKPHFRQAGEFLAEHARPGDVLLNLHDSTYFSLRYYAPQVESYILQNEQPWLLPEAWPRFGTHVTEDWVSARPTDARLWVAIEPRLFDARQQASLASLDREWRRLAQFEEWGVHLILFQRRH